MEKVISCEWERQESRNCNTHMRQNRFQKKKKAIKKDKGHYLMIKGSIQEEGYCTCLHTCT